MLCGFWWWGFDGNKVSHAKVGLRWHGRRGVEMRIWKDKTPKGDGNRSARASAHMESIWKDKTPKGDGNLKVFTYPP